MRWGRGLSVPSLHGCRGVTQAALERCYLQGFCPHPVFKDLFQLEYSRYSGLPEFFSWMSGDKMETQDSILLPPGGSFWVWEWAGVLPGLSAPGQELYVVLCFTEPTSFSSYNLSLFQKSRP